MTEIRVDTNTLLRLPRAADAVPLFELIDSNRAHLGRWLGWVDSTRGPEDTRVFIEGHRGSNTSSGEMALLIEHAGEIGGVIGLRGRGTINRAGEIGYWLSEQLQGRGIMTRSCRALLEFAFGEGELNRVVIRVEADNARCRVIPVRLGFKLEGTERQSIFSRGDFQDAERFVMLASEWEVAKRGPVPFELAVDDELLLRRARLEDAEPLYALIDANREYLSRFMPPWTMQSAEEERRWVENILSSNESGTRGMLMVYRGELVGGIGLRAHDGEARVAEIGYWLVEKLQRRGIVTRSCRRLLDHAFDDLDFNRVQIRVMPENDKSRAIPERLGFTFEGVLRQSAAFGVKITDLGMYSILASEWHQPS